jgi:hypothetical protein
VKKAEEIDRRSGGVVGLKRPDLRVDPVVASAFRTVFGNKSDSEMVPWRVIRWTKGTNIMICDKAGFGLL